MKFFLLCSHLEISNILSISPQSNPKDPLKIQNQHLNLITQKLSKRSSPAAVFMFMACFDTIAKGME